MTPADWQDFAEMTGGASGGLTGLLFVAVSLNATRIGHHRGLRASAAQTLVLFLAPLAVAAALLTPDQPDWVLGAELTIAGLGTTGILLSIRRVKQSLSDDEQTVIAIFNRRATNVLIMLLLTASGVLVACGLPGGLYLLLPVILVALISGVLNAWYFLLPPPSAQPDTPSAAAGQSAQE